MKLSTADLTDLAAYAADESGFFNRDDLPFTAAVTPGDMRRFVVVGGANASGKSLFVRVLDSFAVMPNRKPNDPKARNGLSISIRERTESSIGRAFVFGEERSASTGATSVRVVESAFRNMDNRTGVLILDEPELGLSQGFCAAMGELIAEQAVKMPDTALGLVLVSHSKDLVRRFRDALGGTPTFVSMDPDGAATLDAWVERRDESTVEALRALPTVNHERFRATHDVLGL